MKKYLEGVNPRILLAISIVAEVCGATSLKLSDGFAHIPFALLTICLYAISLGIFTVALEHLPLGFAYGVWGGVGTAATTIIGIIAWGDAFGWGTCLGVVLLIGGIVLLNTSTNELEGKRSAQ